jgi:hypothetical protein
MTTHQKTTCQITVFQMTIRQMKTHPKKQLEMFHQMLVPYPKVTIGAACQMATHRMTNYLMTTRKNLAIGQMI